MNIFFYGLIFSFVKEFNFLFISFEVLTFLIS